MRLIPIFFLFFGLFFARCGDGKRDISAYYFPTDALREQSKVYEYTVSQNGVEGAEYWYYRAFLRDTGLFLSGTYYDERFRIGQILREKIANSGVQVRDYFIYDTDESGDKQVQSQASIISPHIFPHAVLDSSRALFRMSYTPADPSLGVVQILHDRVYLGDAPDFEFQGKKYPCIRFGLRAIIKTDEIVESMGEEWYAEDIGLVYYRKNFGEDLKIEGRLRDIFPMAELERRAAEYYGD